MSRIVASAILSSRFSYEPRTKTFCAEISDFNPKPFSTLFGQAFDDACDEGFQIESVKTGARVLFTFDRVEKDAEGDIVAWHFAVYNPRSNPVFSGMTAVIFND